MWYIFKDDGRCLAACDSEPNHDDLLTRKEVAVEMSAVYSIADITLGDGEIIQNLPCVPSIDKEKDAKWEKIKAIRDQKEREPLAYLDKIFDFDSLSSERLTWLIDAARTAITFDSPFAVNWTCYDNTVIELSSEQIIGIPLAVAQRSDGLHQIARSLREQIEEATTEEELAIIVWPE